MGPSAPRSYGMHSHTAPLRGFKATALVLGLLMAMVAVTPFGFFASAQDASPEAEAAPTGLAALGLQEIVVTASASTYSLSFTPPLVEGWALVTLVNESESPAVVNVGMVPEGQSVGDLSSAVFSAFQGTGGELPEWWTSATFAGGSFAPAGGTTHTAVYLTPGKWAAFSTNPMSAQAIQTFAVASEEDLVNLYGIEPEASPVADASPVAAPVIEGLPSDGTVSIDAGAYTIEGGEVVAGPQVWNVTNNSDQVAEFVLVSVDYEIPAEEAVLWAQTFAAGTLGNAVVQNGSGLLSPGAQAYVQVDLAPGTYVLFSTAPDTAGGIQSDNGLNLVFTVAG